MRQTHLSLLTVALALFAAACSRDDGVSVNARPPLGGVRFVNAVADGGPVDIRMVDQVDWSASSVNGTNVGLAFRAGTIHWATEAKPRHIRVFPTDTSLAVATQVLHDTTITIDADKDVTLMLVGSRVAGGHVSFIKIDDTAPALSGAKIAVRLVNASPTGSTSSNADAYFTAKDTSTVVAGTTPAIANVGPFGVSPYVVRDTAQFAARAAATGNQTTFWSAAAPAGAPASGSIGVTAGAGGPGSALSAYLFPASVAGTKAPSSFTKPGIVWFVDHVPAPTP